MIDYNKRKYWKLMNYLKYESRAFFDDEIKSILDELSSHMLSSTIKISKDTILYRSQLGCNYDDEGIEIPYPPARMFPLEKEASEGRANPKGISYLYLATSKDISVSEVRPWPGKYISLGYFTVKKNLILVDFTIGKTGNFYIDLQHSKLLAKDDIESL